MFIRSAYNYDRDEASLLSGVDCQVMVVLNKDTGEFEFVATPSLAKQSFAEECDINTIVRRFGLTGQLPQGVRMPTYGDFQDVPDYHAAMSAIREAQEAFYAMPGEVRARFHNDPGEFVGFCSDEKNREEAVKLGLVMPAAAALAAQAAPEAAPPAPVAVSVAPAAPAAPAKV